MQIASRPGDPGEDGGVILAGRSGPARLMWRRSILDARLAFVWRSSSPRNRPLLQPLEKVALGSRARLRPPFASVPGVPSRISWLLTR